MKLLVDDAPVSLEDLRKVWEAPCEIAIGDNSLARVAAAQVTVDSIIASGEQVYGLNTGFGQLAQVRISDDELAHLQENLIRSHAVGVGALLPDEVVRLTMVMKVVALGPSPPDSVAAARSNVR